jgi:hypothetical protein
MLYGRLLDKYAYCVETLSDSSDPAVLLSGGEGRCNGFIHRFRRDIDRVLDISDVSHENFARS